MKLIIEKSLVKPVSMFKKYKRSAKIRPEKCIQFASYIINNTLHLYYDETSTFSKLNVTRNDTERNNIAENKRSESNEKVTANDKNERRSKFTDMKGKERSNLMEMKGKEKRKKVTRTDRYGRR
jgi:hypothetical protein